MAAGGRIYFLGQLKEPNSPLDRYIDDHGMSFGLEDQKPQPQAPQPPLGLFFWVNLFGQSSHP